MGLPINWNCVPPASNPATFIQWIINEAIANGILTFPSGGGTLVCKASESITSGNFVNLFLDSGIVKARKANATDNTKPAHGFILQNAIAGDDVTVYFESNLNTDLAGLTIGVDYYLSTTPGMVTATPPSASGNLVQFLGVATKVTELPYINSDTVEVA